jgi:hypothetical protein
LDEVQRQASAALQPQIETLSKQIRLLLHHRPVSLDQELPAGWLTVLAQLLTVYAQLESVQSSSLLSKESSMISLAINKDEHEYVVPRCKETVIENMIRRKRRDTTRMAAKMGRRAIC